MNSQGATYRIPEPAHSRLSLPFACGSANIREFHAGNRWGRGLLYGLLLSVATFLPAQGFLPDAPVKGFELPWFDPQTHRLSMKLLGDEGLLKTDGSVKIQGMTIHFYSPETGELPQTTITSPNADVFPSQSIARGEDELKVKAELFSLEGKNWEWHWKNNRLEIKEGVQLNLKQDLGPILQ